MHPKVQWLFSRCTWFHVLSSNSVPLRLVVRNDTAPVSCDERNYQGAIATMMDAEESCIRVHTCSEAFSWQTRKLRLRRKVHMYVFFVPGKIRFRVPLHDDGTTDGRRIGAVIPSVPYLLSYKWRSSFKTWCERQAVTGLSTFLFASSSQQFEQSVVSYSLLVTSLVSDSGLTVCVTFQPFSRHVRTCSLVMCDRYERLSQTHICKSAYVIYKNDYIRRNNAGFSSL